MISLPQQLNIFSKQMLLQWSKRLVVAILAILVVKQILTQQLLQLQLQQLTVQGRYFYTQIATLEREYQQANINPEAFLLDQQTALDTFNQLKSNYRPKSSSFQYNLDKQNWTLSISGLGGVQMLQFIESLAIMGMIPVTISMEEVADEPGQYRVDAVLKSN